MGNHDAEAVVEHSVRMIDKTLFLWWIGYPLDPDFGARIKRTGPLISGRFAVNEEQANAELALQSRR